MKTELEICQAAETELLSLGLRPSQVIADGKKHRCPVEGKPKSLDGEYCIYADERLTLVWRNYRTDQYGVKRLFLHEQAAPEKAHYILSLASSRIAVHQYLIGKGFEASLDVPGLKVKDGRLLVPAFDTNGQLSTLQFISADGQKKFLKNGKMQGASFTLKGEQAKSPIYLAEGLATALSIWLALEKQAEVRVCFSAGNLPPVAKALRQKEPREIIICADNDCKTTGNPGLKKAIEAAREVDGLVSLATFDDETGGTDFNDIHQAKGLDEVKRQHCCPAKRYSLTAAYH